MKHFYQVIIYFQDGTYPTVVVGMFIEQATPFLEEYLNKIVAQDYPKSSLHLFIHNKVRFSIETVDVGLNFAFFRLLTMLNN
jgi:hypothetical protein